MLVRAMAMVQRAIACGMLSRLRPHLRSFLCCASTTSSLEGELGLAQAQDDDAHDDMHMMVNKMMISTVMAFYHF